MKKQEGFTLIELLVVLAIIGVLIALLLPAIQTARESARRTHCAMNLTQIALALQNYAMAHEVLPPGTIHTAGPIRTEEKGYHFSWLTQLLPYLEKNNHYEHLNFKVGVYDPANTTITELRIDRFSCPSDANAKTSYAGCHHDVEAPIDSNNNGVFFLNSSLRPNEIKDGKSNTIFVGEKIVESWSGWAPGTRATLRNTGWAINDKRLTAAALGLGIQASNVTAVYGFGSHHIGGANFAFGDGSIRFLSEHMDQSVYQSLGHRSDGKPLEEF